LLALHLELEASRLVLLSADGVVGDREKHIHVWGSGGSLEPPGPILEPLGLFLHTFIPFI
jgi:hypothetical protein